MKKSYGLKIKEIAYISFFSVFIAVCSWISVPFLISYTMQSFGVFLCMGVLGGKKGTISVLVYILLGICGLPVFSGFSGGIGVIMGATGGYIIGFLAAALVMWLLERLFYNSDRFYLISMLIGLFICYLVGTVWFAFVYTQSNADIGLWTVLVSCVVPFIIPDILKILLALYIRKRIVFIIKDFGG